MSTMHDRFARPLMHPDRPPPAGLASWNSSDPGVRYDVYRNNVMISLRRALASRFPVTERIVGEAFFAAMADSFIRLHPPRSPLLFRYGDELAGFAADFPPAAALPYLPDVIRLESAGGRAYHAADIAPLDPARLSEVPPGRLPGLRFALHPSVSVIRSAYPVVTIWAMNAGEAAVAPVTDWSGQDALVVRPHLTVEVLQLPPGGGAFLDALAAGQDLQSAAEDAAAAKHGFDLAANIAGALRSGVFTAIRHQGEEP